MGKNRSRLGSNRRSAWVLAARRGRNPREAQDFQDGSYGYRPQRTAHHLGIEEAVIAYRSPWQNPFVERLIGSIRRECLDHVIVFNEVHLLRIPRDYFAYYHDARTHLSLDRNAPIPRQGEPPQQGQVIAIPQVGGLHHRYARAAA